MSRIAYPVFRLVFFFALFSFFCSRVSFCAEQGPRTESLEFTVSYMGVSAGKGTLDTFQNDAGVTIRATGSTSNVFAAFYHVYDIMESFCPKGSFFPSKYKIHFEEGDYRRKNDFVFDFAKLTVTGHKDGPVKIEPETYDPLSGFAFVRTLDMEPGQTISRYVCDGRKLYWLTLKVHDRRILSTRFGRIPCIEVEPDILNMRLEGVMEKKGRVRIWLTDDEHKIPIMVKGKVLIGSLIAHLCSADRGTRKILQKIKQNR